VAILLDAFSITSTRADRILFHDLSLTISTGDRIGVVGINGTGKSTLLRVLSGQEVPEAGEVRRGRGTRVVLLDQDAEVEGETVREAVGDQWETKAVLDRLAMSHAMDSRLKDLSGGQLKRVALAQVLTTPAEVLILDEPTNHLDLPTITWLEQWLKSFRGAVVVVSHDRHLLDSVTTKMLELDRGSAYLHNSGYGGYLTARFERDEKSADDQAVRRNLARRELAWLQRGAKARSRKPQARVDAARQLLETKAPTPARATPLELDFDIPRLGRDALEATDISLTLGDQLILRETSLVVTPEDRVGVVGVNGSGKSTLLDLLAKVREPSSGTVRYGSTVRLAYYTQRPIQLDPKLRVRDVVAGPHRTPGDLFDQRLMERFWFTGELPWATVGTLSGGERKRLQLLCTLALRPNVLVLDEPTNDFDLDTLRALEEYLDDFPGAVIVVSHDRSFLQRVTERVIVVDHQQARAIPGGLDSWIAQVTSQESSRTSSERAEEETSNRSTQALRPDRIQGPRRSTSTLSHSLRETEREISKVQRQIDAAEAAFSAATNHSAMASHGHELAELQRGLRQLEDRWIELASEIEHLRQP
jgi:ATP-binding cassette subfamily F protein uup